MSFAKVVKAPQGKWLLKSMFFELCPLDKRERYCSFTLKDEDHEGFYSLKQLYLAYRDPTEYEFATNVLGSYDHWKQLCKCEWFIPFVESWREELEAKITSEAIKSIAEFSKEDKGFQAAKWLAEKGYKPKQPGAKSKAAKEKEDRINQMVDDDLSSDAKRLNIKVVN